MVLSIARLVDELAGPLPSGRPRTELVDFVADRPGHDFRYAMNIEKISRELGWRPSRTFEEGLRETVAWFLAEPRLVRARRRALPRRAARPRRRVASGLRISVASS